MNKDEKLGAWLTVAITAAVITFAVVYSGTAKAQFREQESWKFKTPYERAVDLQIHQSIMLRDGGYFDGEHTARYYNVDMDVEHMDAEGFQEVTNIGNLNSTTVTGDGNTLNVDGIQRSEEQTGLNGMASRNSTTEGMINVD